VNAHGWRETPWCVHAVLSSLTPLTFAKLQQGVCAYGEEHARLWDLARGAR